MLKFGNSRTSPELNNLDFGAPSNKLNKKNVSNNLSEEQLNELEFFLNSRYRSEQSPFVKIIGTLLASTALGLGGAVLGGTAGSVLGLGIDHLLGNPSSWLTDPSSSPGPVALGGAAGGSILGAILPVIWLIRETRRHDNFINELRQKLEKYRSNALSSTSIKKFKEEALKFLEEKEKEKERFRQVYRAAPLFGAMGGFVA